MGVASNTQEEAIAVGPKGKGWGRKKFRAGIRAPSLSVCFLRLWFTTFVRLWHWCVLVWQNVFLVIKMHKIWSF